MAKMKIEFFGATREVTGSCFLITVGQRRLLVDCGLIQGLPEDEERNSKPFPFDVKTLDAVVLTHAHLDHSGRLPLLVKAGYNGPIHTHHASQDLCRILLRDAAYLNEKEVEWENRKRRRKHHPLVEPLYTRIDAEEVMGLFKSHDYGEMREILPGVRMRLNDAGHILGSAITELWLEDKGEQRKLVFSGDLGHRGAPILRDPTPIEEADLVVMETTYGNRYHRSWEETWSELAEILEHARARRGNVLIPSFAVGRTQELLYAFHRNYDAWDLDRWTIFLDSPMAIEATEVYQQHHELYDKETLAFDIKSGDPFTPPNLHLTRRAEESMAINEIESGAIIIAGSGMCNGGRIKHHIKHNIWRRDCHLVIVGFQARGTLGRHLVDGAKRIKLWGEEIVVAAQVHTVGGFSAHADADGLAAWYRHFKHRPPLVLVHGEPDAMDPFAERMQEAGAQQVFKPELGTALDLVSMQQIPTQKQGAK